MPIEFDCVRCGQRLRVPDTAAGKQARCPACQTQMPVPGTPVGVAPPFARPVSPVSSNPFAESAALGPEPAGAAAAGDPLNPYAAPLGVAEAFEGEVGIGLPWENEPMGLGTWWRTTKWCLTEPSRAFAALRPRGDIGRAILFCGLGLLIGGLASTVWGLPLGFLGSVVDGARPPSLDELLFALVLQLFLQVVGALSGATVGLLLGAVIAHVCLWLVGGANRPFETTLRVLAYANGATAWLNVVPCVGPLVGFVGLLALEVAGLAATHGISQGRALLAVLLPLLVCGLVCGLGFAALFVATLRAA